MTTPTTGAAELPEALLLEKEFQRQRAAYLHAQSNVALLADILNRRPALNAGLAEAYGQWTAEVYDLMGAMSAVPANDAQVEALRAQAAPAAVAVPDDAMVHAALRVQYPAAYGEHLRHPANGPRTSARTEAEIDLARRMIAAAIAAAPAAQGDALARRLFDAGWKASARYCGRDDVVADGIVGFGACPQFESDFAAALAAQKRSA